MRLFIFLVLVMLTFIRVAYSGSTHSGVTHGISMHGSPSLPVDYEHFTYANPDAPQGGDLTYGVYGTFDSLNPFILKSMRTTARGIWDSVYGHFVYESLLKRNRDEPFTLYGLLAERVELPDSRDWIEFHLHPDAYFSDGSPVEVSDIIFTFGLLGEKGRPPYSSRMSQVSMIERTGARSLKIHFNDTASRETPLLFGLMPIFSMRSTDPDTFGESTLVPPVGSGPYLVDEVSVGERISFVRNENYWGRDEPVNRGFHNFDSVTIDYYGNTSAMFEAFKKGLFDIYVESSPARWSSAYDFGAITEGTIQKSEFTPDTPSGMLGFVFNTRRPPLDNRTVREALAMAFDFEWANQNLFFGGFERTTSYWQNSVLSSYGVPAGPGELALLENFPDSVSPSVMDGTYRAPRSDGSGRDRRILSRVLSLLRSEGFVLSDGRLLDSSGVPLQIELLVGSSLGGQDMERLVLNYKSTLERLGITLTPRFVDDSQFQSRKGVFDYDMIVGRYSSSLSPGAEQRFRWGSISRSLEGSFNLAGTSDPAIDFLIEAMLNARTTSDFTDAVRAYDRVLISGHYVVPLYHLPTTFVAHKSSLSYPDHIPVYGPRFATWWFSPN